MTVSEYAYEYEKQNVSRVALGRMLARAAKAGLCPLAWRISPSGVLIGENSGSHSRAALEQLFEQWAGFLGEGLVREEDCVFASSTDVLKTAFTNSAPGVGKGITVRLRITVSSELDPYL